MSSDMSSRLTSCFNAVNGMRSIAIALIIHLCETLLCFNAVNGMRSIAIPSTSSLSAASNWFQCRKRHEVNCNTAVGGLMATAVTSFNAVNGMRSIAMQNCCMREVFCNLFQCRKRHEVNCNFSMLNPSRYVFLFQCRKRHEVNCNPVHQATGKKLWWCFNAVNGMRSIAIRQLNG